MGALYAGSTKRTITKSKVATVPHAAAIEVVGTPRAASLPAVRDMMAALKALPSTSKEASSGRLATKAHCGIALDKLRRCGLNSAWRTMRALVCFFQKKILTCGGMALVSFMG